MRVVAVLILLALPAQAEEWRALDGPAIDRALTGTAWRFADGSEQLFFPGGITRYRHGWPNEGRWRVRGDHYCSLWPPGQDWTCFAVESTPDLGRLRFEGPDHRISEGWLVGEAQWP